MVAKSGPLTGISNANGLSPDVKIRLKPLLKLHQRKFSQCEVRLKECGFLLAPSKKYFRQLDILNTPLIEKRLELDNHKEVVFYHGNSRLYASLMSKIIGAWMGWESIRFPSFPVKIFFIREIRLKPLAACTVIFLKV